MLSQAEHYVMKEIEKLGGIPEIDQSIDLIQEYISKAIRGEYYDSKNIRLNQWNPDKGEINELVLSVFTLVLQYKPMIMQSIVSILARRISLDEHISQVTTVAECIALISRTGLINISHTHTGSYIMVNTEYNLDGIPEQDYHEILYEPPPEYTKNWHEDYGHRILGGKYNQHDGNICLDHINRMNSIPYQLNKALLSKYEETPTYAFTDKYGNFSIEKRDQWITFIRNSYRKYIEICNKGNVFYLNHNDDKRGRCYAEGYHVNTQGSSFKKAIIQLANEELVEV